jgi:hypothetical protein
MAFGCRQIIEFTNKETKRNASNTSRREVFARNYHDWQVRNLTRGRWATSFICEMLNDIKNTIIRNSLTDTKMLYIKNKIRAAETFMGIDTKYGDRNETNTLKSLFNDTTALVLLGVQSCVLRAKRRTGPQNCNTK